MTRGKKKNPKLFLFILQPVITVVYMIIDIKIVFFIVLLPPVSNVFSSFIVVLLRLSRLTARGQSCL